jgi:transposase-like protein
MKKRINIIPDEVKLQVVTEYISSDITREELKVKYGFTGGANIDRWMKQFGVKKPSVNEITQFKEMSKVGDKTKEDKVLEDKIKELEKQLAHAKLKARALDAMIDIAEKEFDIQIRKKSGPKQ